MNYQEPIYYPNMNAPCSCNMPNYNIDPITDLNNRVTVLEQKMQFIEQKLNKTPADSQNKINDGMYQYESSMHMM